MITVFTSITGQRSEGAWEIERVRGRIIKKKGLFLQIHHGLVLISDGQGKGRPARLLLTKGEAFNAVYFIPHKIQIPYTRYGIPHKYGGDELIRTDK